MRAQNSRQPYLEADFKDLAKEIWEAFFVVRYQNDGEPYERSRLRATISSKYKDELGWVSDALFQLKNTRLFAPVISMANFLVRRG